MRLEYLHKYLNVSRSEPFGALYGQFLPKFFCKKRSVPLQIFVSFLQKNLGYSVSRSLPFFRVGAGARLRGCRNAMEVTPQRERAGAGACGSPSKLPRAHPLRALGIAENLARHSLPLPVVSYTVASGGLCSRTTKARVLYIMTNYSTPLRLF